MRTPKEKELSMLSLILRHIVKRCGAIGTRVGHQAMLLDQPHTADVRILEQSEFYVAFKKMGGEPPLPGQWAP